jgi:ATP-dependent Lhr-like helicase
MVFQLLAHPIQEAIAERGFKKPTEPQSKAIPLIMEGKNVLLIAPTGTGKTEAAFLPLMDFLLRCKREKGIKALYITPLRALNRDMLERMIWWCRRLDLRLAVRHGDTSIKERSLQAAAPPDVLITTPETLQAILPARIIKKHLKKVRWVVVDEVHELASDKRGSQLSLGLERLRYLAGDFQVIGLSATIGTPKRVGKFLVGTNRECEIVQVSIAREMNLKVLFPEPEEGDYELANALYTFPEVAARLRVVRELVESYRSSLIFTNTRSTAEVLASRFRVWDIDFPLRVHHGSLSKPSRVAAERELKSGELKGIVCTSSLELGIDIGRLDLVIQYNSPRQVTRLVQRVGRSGHRIGETARGVIIAQDSDDFLESLVIAKRSKEESLEPVNIPEKPLDVLSHQIAGLLLEKRRWTFDEALRILTEAYPYRNLTEDDLIGVLEYMSSRIPRLAFYSKGERTFMRPRSIKELYRYYFETLSMIPEEKHFIVIEEESDSPIGLLDEAFVSEYGEIGTKFVEGGCIWKILQIYQDKIYVKAEDDPAGAIPSWVGEEIPVPFEVAQEVGALRGWIERELQKGNTVDQVIKKLEDLPADRRALARGIREIAEQVDSGFPVPTDRRIIIESWREFIIIHCCFGLLVNKTLARILGHIFSEELGSPVGVQQDPYRVVVKTEIPADKVKEILIGLGEKDLPNLYKQAVVRTRIFKRRLVHVARKFGAIEKGADISTLKLSTLVKAFKGTAIYEEALESVLRDDSDIEGLASVSAKISSGEIDIVIVEGITPIGRVGIEEMERRYDIMPPGKMKAIIRAATKSRLLSEAGVLICAHCWNVQSIRRVKDLPKNIFCASCGSRKVAFLCEDEENVARLGEKMRSGIKPSGHEGKLLEKIQASAALVEKYGRAATLVLAGRNVSPKAAAKILEKGQTEETLVDLIIEEEKKSLKKAFLRRHRSSGL